MKFSLCNGAYPGKDVEYHLEKVKEHSFHGLEYYRWWNLDISKISNVIEKIGIPINSICAPYISITDPKHRDDYIDGLNKTLLAANRLGSTSIVSQTGNFIPYIGRDSQKSSIIETLKRCSELLENQNIILEIEPLNSLINHPGYFLQYSNEANEIIDSVGSPNIKICFDFYHQQISEGNVINNFNQYYSNINHVHLADNPGRTEPGLGELNFKTILKTIRERNYSGFVGLECKFSKDTDLCLEEFKNLYNEVCK